MAEKTWHSWADPSRGNLMGGFGITQVSGEFVSTEIITLLRTGQPHHYEIPLDTVFVFKEDHPTYGTGHGLKGPYDYDLDGYLISSKILLNTGAREVIVKKRTVFRLKDDQYQIGTKHDHIPDRYKGSRYPSSTGDTHPFYLTSDITLLKETISTSHVKYTILSKENPLLSTIDPSRGQLTIYLTYYFDYTLEPSKDIFKPQNFINNHLKPLIDEQYEELNIFYEAFAITIPMGGETPDYYSSEKEVTSSSSNNDSSKEEQKIIKLIGFNMNRINLTDDYFAPANIRAIVAKLFGTDYIVLPAAESVESDDN